MLQLKKMSIVAPDWRLALFSGVFLLIFLNLGFWQLDRSEEKQLMLKEAEVRANNAGVDITADIKVEVGQRLRTRGKFAEKPVFYIDNRVLNGRVGYEVVQVFEAAEFSVLVNRGFVPGGQTRQELPELPPYFAGEQEITGLAYLTELAEPEQNFKSGDPIVAQVIKPQSLGDAFDLELFSHVLRLDEAHPDALPRYWPVSTMSPERHMGYAVTWFAMALALSLAFATTVVKRAS